jgi:hypothetical protein
MQTDSNRLLAAETKEAPESRRGLLMRVAFSAALIGLFGLLVSRLNLRRDLSRLDVGILSGVPEGNYHKLVENLAGLAIRQKGKVRNVASEGSFDNVQKLAAAQKKCDVSIGLTQDGTPFEEPKPTLIARLPKAESVFFLGKNADQIHEFAQLRGLKIGIGPSGSGAEALVRQLMLIEELGALELKLSNHQLVDQLDLAAKGELDLAVVVMDEDAGLVKKAITEQGLQIAGFNHADVIARRIAHLRTGRIGAGEYDPVKLLPPEDKKVLRIETLVLANSCAGRSQIIDTLILLAKQFPDLVRHNVETPNATGLELSATSRDFFGQNGPELADEYVPWLVDVMPPANWAYVVMGISLLFNAMGFGHRFRLWRIDVARVNLESELTKVFGSSATVGDIARASPTGELGSPERKQVVEKVIRELEDLSAKSRRYSLSMLVPMGQEMAYRYQEELIHQTLAALRTFQSAKV